MTAQSHTESPAILTSRRDIDDFISPAKDLVNYRDSGEWPSISLDHPEYPGTTFDAVGVTRYVEVRQILGDERINMGIPRSGAPGSFGNQDGVLIYYNGADHTRLRRKLNRSLTIKRVEVLRPRIEKIVTDLLDGMESRGTSGDLMEDFAVPLPTQVTCELLGVPFEDRKRFLAWAPVINNLTLPSDVVLGVIKELHDYMAELVAHFKTAPHADNVLSGLVHDGDLTDEEIVGLGMQLFVAGQDTTAYVIGLGTVALLERPDQLAAIRDDESIALNAVEELVRYLSLVSSPPNRLMTVDGELAGTRVAAGDRIIVSLLAANWDPELVGDSPDLDVHRAPVAHVGFGYGPHQCAGQHLARLELSIALPALYRRFPNLRLALPKADLDWHSQHAAIYGLGSAPVEW